MPDTTAWNEIVPEAITSCKTCEKKIWKYWHVGKRDINRAGKKETVYPEMDTCAYCHFEMYKNPLKVRKLSELEIAKYKVSLLQMMEEYDPGEKLIAKGNLNNV